MGRRPGPVRVRVKPRVVIVGGGFAGLAAAQALPPTLAVTLIDRREHFEFAPNIHELVSGRKAPAALRIGLAAALQAWGHGFVQATVRRLDPHGRVVFAADGRAFPYEYLMVAVGGENDDFGVPGASAHALPFKSVDECTAIRHALEARSAAGGPLRVVIVGGGLEGIEALGEVLRAYRRRPGLALALVEAGPRLLPQGPPAVDRSVRAHAARHGVQLHMQRRVAAVGADAVRLDDDTRLASELTLWTGGVRAPALLQEAGLTGPQGGFAPVRDTLRAVHAEAVFVVGDAADFPAPLPKQAYHALAMGRHAAQNLVRLAAGGPLEPFRPRPKPTLLAFGDLDTYLIAGAHVLAGAPLAALKEGILQWTLAQLEPPATNPTAALRRLGRRLQAGLAGALPALPADLASLRQAVGVRRLA